MLVTFGVFLLEGPLKLIWISASFMLSKKYAFHIKLTEIDLNIKLSIFQHLLLYDKNIKVWFLYEPSIMF